jgi:hypothetical protein
MGWKRRTALAVVAGGMAIGQGALPAAAEPAASGQAALTFTSVEGVEVTCSVQGSSSVRSEERDGFLVVLMTFETNVVDDPGCADAVLSTRATLGYRRSDSGEVDSGSARSSGTDASGSVQVNGVGVSTVTSGHQVDFGCLDPESGQPSTCSVSFELSPK